MLRDKTPGTNHHIILYDDTIQQDRSHANQHPVSDSAAVKHDFMADGNIFPYNKWIAVRVI